MVTELQNLVKGVGIEMKGDAAEKLLITIFILVFWFVATFLIKRYLLHRLDDQVAYKYSRTIRLITFLFLFFGLLRIWLPTFKLGTFLGLLSAGLAIAAKDYVMGLLGWLYVSLRRPFKVGDRIAIGQVQGDVIDIGFISFWISELTTSGEGDVLTGHIVHVPMTKIFTENITNYFGGFGYTWHLSSFTVTFESDWKKAKAVLLEVLNEHSQPVNSQVQNRVQEARRRYFMRFGSMENKVYTNLKPNGVHLIARYLCPPRKKRETESNVVEGFLGRIARIKTIDLAYPTNRAFFNQEEGKIPSTKPGRRKRK